MPFVLLRELSATFLSRGDTATPVKALAVGVAVDVALKIVLMKPFAQVGLAFATSVGVWIKLLLLLWFALRARLLSFDKRLQTSTLKLFAAAAVLALALWLGGAILGSLLRAVAAISIRSDVAGPGSHRHGRLRGRDHAVVRPQVVFGLPRPARARSRTAHRGGLINRGRRAAAPARSK